VAFDHRADLTYVLIRADAAHQPILAVDRRGRIVRSWGAGLFVIPHNIKVDAQGNVWTTDAGTSRVIQFSPQGKELSEFVLGDTPTAASGGCAFLANPSNGNLDFCGTTDVTITPAGRIFVTDGYGKKRVLEYSSAGTRVREWGGAGKGQSSLTLPHGLAFDGKDTLFVADRDGGRIVRFSLDGRYLGEWSHLGNAGALAFANGALWAAVALPANDAATGATTGATLARRPTWVVKIDPVSGNVLGTVETSATDYIDVSANGEVVAGVVSGGFVRYRPIR
jgi:sugar lactone lactonase YvrE